jgi:hypothetical protein
MTNKELDRVPKGNGKEKAMAETTKKNEGKPHVERPKAAKEGVNVEPAAQSVEKSLGGMLEGFTPAEIASLLRVRQAIAQGRYSDITPEFKKLLFVKWLVEHERIGS